MRSILITDISVSPVAYCCCAAPGPVVPVERETDEIGSIGAIVDSVSIWSLCQQRVYLLPRSLVRPIISCTSMVTGVLDVLSSPQRRMFTAPCLLQKMPHPLQSPSSTYHSPLPNANVGVYDAQSSARLPLRHSRRFVLLEQARNRQQANRQKGGRMVQVSPITVRQLGLRGYRLPSPRGSG